MPLIEQSSFRYSYANMQHKDIYNYIRSERINDDNLLQKISLFIKNGLSIKKHEETPARFLNLYSVQVEDVKCQHGPQEVYSEVQYLA